MNVIITNHAIEQFHRRTFGPMLPESEITKILTQTVKHGKKECQCPPFDKNIFKVTHKDLSVLVDFRDEHAVIMTFLGDKKYQKWHQRVEIRPRAFAC